MALLCLVAVLACARPAMTAPLTETIEGTPPAIAQTGAPPPNSAPVPLDEVTIMARRLEAVGAAIEPQIGASIYTVTGQAIETQPGGANNTVNQVLLQTPGVTQDAQSAGGIHVRNEMQPLEFRINGIALPAGLSLFGQGLSPRFANSFKLITGALPAEYGLSTSGIVDIQTKNGLFDPGGSVALYGGSNETLHPSAEYGGSLGGYNYYVAGDLVGTNRGIDAVTANSTQIHDHSSQRHAFAYLDKIIDGENRVTAIVGLFDDRFEIPNNPSTPAFPGIAFLNGAPVSAFNPALLDARQTETSRLAVLSYLYSGPAVDYRVSAFTKYSTLDFRHDPSLADIAFNAVAQNASLKSFADGVQVDASGKIAAGHTLRSGLLFVGERFTSETVSSLLVQDGTGGAGGPTFGSAPGTSIPSRIFGRIGKTGRIYSGWLQDEWKLMPNLTVNYGGRFDVVDQFVTGNQISPRLNLVWEATPTTVLHAGYANLFTPPPFQLAPPGNLIQFNNFNGTGLTTSAATPSALNDPLKIERANLFDLSLIPI